jgi:hypothetical protein
VWGLAYRPKGRGMYCGLWRRAHIRCWGCLQGLAKASRRGEQERKQSCTRRAVDNSGHKLAHCCRACGCCTFYGCLTSLRHAIGMKMGLRRMEEGFGAPTRAMPLARFLAEGVSLISYSWLGGHIHPKLQLSPAPASSTAQSPVMTGLPSLARELVQCQKERAPAHPMAPGAHE